MTAPSIEALGIWATAIATLIVFIQRQYDKLTLARAEKLAKNTNDLVNGQHGVALKTIVTQAKIISSVTGTPEDRQKVIDAQAAVLAHEGGGGENEERLSTKPPTKNI
jgi:hypothetical protein